MAKISIKEVQPKIKEVKKEEKIVITQKQGKIKEIKKEPEKEEKQEQELTLEEKIALIQRMRSAQLARQQMALQSQAVNRAPALEQVAAQEAPQPVPRTTITQTREEPKIEERKTGYTEIKKEYATVPGRSTEATYTSNRQEGGRTYEGKKEEKEEARAPILGQARIRDREADAFKMNRENKDLSDPLRTQTYQNDTPEEKKKKKDLW